MDWRSTGNQTSDVVQWMVNDSNNNNSSPVGASQIVLDKFVSSSLHLMGANGGGTALNVATPTADLVTAEEMYRDPLSVLITVTVLYSVIFVVGLVGNIITCIVISRNKSMHTATNYYLFNLAITDMLMLVSAMPPDLYNAWNPWQYPFDSAICVLQGLLAETSTNVTILTISCFTIERYIAICHPFLQHSMSKLSRAVKFIIGIWIGALTAALPQACQFGVVTINNAVLCTVKNETISYAFEISSLIFFVSPMILICVLYVLIGLKLRQSSRLIAKFSHRSSRPSRGSSCSNNNINQAQGNGKTKDRPLTTSTSSPDVAYNQIAQQQSGTPKKSQRRIIKMLSELINLLDSVFFGRKEIVANYLHCCCFYIYFSRRRGRFLPLLGSVSRAEIVGCLRIHGR